MTRAEEKRIEVMRRIRDVIHHATGPRLHDNVSVSRSVRPEVYKLLQDGLIEPCDRDGDVGYCLTTAGTARLREAEK